MHYKNGRPAANGDKVLLMNEYGVAVVGILYDAKAGNDYCNGKLAPIAPNDPCPNLKECLHFDDVASAVLESLKPKVAPMLPLQGPAEEACPGDDGFNPSSVG